MVSFPFFSTDVVEARLLSSANLFEVLLDVNEDTLRV